MMVGVMEMSDAYNSPDVRRKAPYRNHQIQRSYGKPVSYAYLIHGLALWD